MVVKIKENDERVDCPRDIVVYIYMGRALELHPRDRLKGTRERVPLYTSWKLADLSLEREPLVYTLIHKTRLCEKENHQSTILLTKKKLTVLNAQKFPYKVHARAHPFLTLRVYTAVARRAPLCGPVHFTPQLYCLSLSFAEIKSRAKQLPRKENESRDRC